MVEGREYVSHSLESHLAGTESRTGSRSKKGWELPGSPVVRTPLSHCRGRRFSPGWGAKIPQAAQCDQTKKKRILEKS